MKVSLKFSFCFLLFGLSLNLFDKLFTLNYLAKLLGSFHHLLLISFFFLYFRFFFRICFCHSHTKCCVSLMYNFKYIYMLVHTHMYSFGFSLMNTLLGSISILV